MRDFLRHFLLNKNDAKVFPMTHTGMAGGLYCVLPGKSRITSRRAGASSLRTRWVRGDANISELRTVIFPYVDVDLKVEASELPEESIHRMATTMTSQIQRFYKDASAEVFRWWCASVPARR